ncbi:MAG: nucleotidyl transferase AbiEii/AbiGii toxin family protein [Tenericutes bacterium]|jgi:predicted nucleotidyltransferase component of viral defense system|nr:nucleotidyl transferase AbiEii/AbiGii toxin family protein [Mycoplasmatota bacterium]
MTIIDQMLEQYDLVTLDDKKNAIKEIMQEIVLAGLSKTNFFKNVAFYGGTALRIYHDLNRFSEDLDFTLLASDKNFTFETYIPMINQTVESLGLKFEISTKKKKQNSNVKSAFLKGNTKEQFLIFYPDSNQEAFVQNNEKIKIKFEIDIDPPLHASTDTSYRLLPFPYEVRIYDKPSLFAGKLHAVIARKWKKRVKGRDLYDYVFYLSTNTPVNLKHLEARLKQTKSIDEDVTLTKESLIDILNNRFDDIDFEDAKNDVFPFIKDIENLDMWSTNFFKSITKNLQVV